MNEPAKKRGSTIPMPQLVPFGLVGSGLPVPGRSPLGGGTTVPGSTVIRRDTRMVSTVLDGEVVVMVAVATRTRGKEVSLK